MEGFAAGQVDWGQGWMVKRLEEQPKNQVNDQI